MKRRKTGELSFNLLALCGDHLADVRQELATNIRRLADLEAKFGSNNNNPDWQPKKANPGDIICSATDPRLATYQLDAEDIQSVPESDTNQPDAQQPSADETVESGLRLWEALAQEQMGLRARYEDELRMAGQEPDAVLGRTKDYTPAIHEWVKKLADHGILRRLHEEVKLQNAP
jgi:ubiquitin carboxyl-terminal hydrolase L5